MSASPEQRSNDATKTITVAIVPARDGYDWLRLSFRLFRLQWLRYCAITALFILIFQFSGLISAGLLAFFLRPVLSVGFLAAAWHHERGEVPEVKHLFAGFRSNISALLPMGLFFLVGVVVSIKIATLVSGLDVNVMIDLAQKAEKGAKVEMPPEVVEFMLIALICMLPVNAALWFAPALVVFSDASFFRALSLSFQAWTRNILAVTVYGVSLIFAALFALVLFVVLLVIVGGAVAPLLAMIALVPLTAVFMISDYVSYRRIFHRTERLQPDQ